MCCPQKDASSSFTTIMLIMDGDGEVRKQAAASYARAKNNHVEQTNLSATVYSSVGSVKTFAKTKVFFLSIVSITRNGTFLFLMGFFSV